MADEAETTITDLPPKPSQERLLHEFTDEFLDPLRAEVEDLFANHNYLHTDQQFDNLVTDLETKAKDAGWKVPKTVAYALVSNVMVKAMLDAGRDLVLEYPIMPPLEAPPAAVSSAKLPGHDDADQIATEGAAGAANAAQGGQAGQEGNAQTQNAAQANQGAIPPVAPLEPAAGVALPNTGAVAGQAQEGAGAADKAS